MAHWSYHGGVRVYLIVTLVRSTFDIFTSIHERSAREKISTDQVAHVLNDEVSRKYIQSLKRFVSFFFHFRLSSCKLMRIRRLLTFSQTKYPPEDVSQLMG